MPRLNVGKVEGPTFESKSRLYSDESRCSIHSLFLTMFFSNGQVLVVSFWFIYTVRFRIVREEWSRYWDDPPYWKILESRNRVIAMSLLIERRVDGSIVFVIFTVQIAFGGECLWIHRYLHLLQKNQGSCFYNTSVWCLHQFYTSFLSVSTIRRHL